MIRLFIENNELDVDKGFSQNITYAIDDLRNVDSKSTPFTKTIILPGTTNNNRVLGNIFDLNNSNLTNDAETNVLYNYNAAKAAQCRLESDGLKVIKGVFRIMEIIHEGSKIEYEVSIIGELGGFSTKMGAAKLEDLDFSAYDHAYNTTNIVNSWDDYNAGLGYYYPLIDYGTYGLNSKHDWKVNTFRAALFTKEYIDKIFEQAGYTYECDLFSTDRFKRLIIPYNRKKFTNYKPYTLDVAAASANYTQADGTSKVMPFPIQTIMENFTYNGGTLEYTYTGGAFVGACTFYLVGQWKKNSSTPFELEIQLNGTAVQTLTWESSTSTVFVPMEETYNFSMSLATSDVLRFVAKQSTATTFELELSTGNCHFQIATGSIVPVEIVLNETVLCNNIIPRNILQKDFFVSILKLFNLYVDEDQWDEKHLVIKPYVEYYTGVIEDWSYKVDRSKPMRSKPMSELNARYYDFKFKPDSDFYNDLYKKRYSEGYGDRRFDSVYEFTSEVQDIEVMFSATPLVGYSGEEKIYSTIFKQTGSTALIEENTDSNIRILVANKISGVTGWAIRNAADTANLLTGIVTYGYAGHLDDPDAPANDLNFGIPNEIFFALATGNLTVNQFNVYYSPYMAEITDKDSRLLTCDVKLNDTDIFNLDFAKYKHIDGGLYRLQRVIDYIPGANKTTKVELLRVLYTTY